MRILCDSCEGSYTIDPVKVDRFENWPADWILRDAELDGWKVNRLVKDVYYGKATCPWCQED